MAITDVGAWLSRQEVDASVAVVGIVAGLTVLVDTLGSWAITAVAGVGVRPLALLVVLATLTVGAAARWGLSLGLLVSGLLLGDWSGGVVAAVAAFVAAGVCSRTWDARRRSDEWFRWLLRYGFVAVLSTLAFAATGAWLSDLLGAAAFSIVVAQSLAANLPLAVLGAPLAWIVVETEGRWTDSTASKTVSTRGGALVAGVLVVWVAGGYVGSFLYQAANTVPIDMFGRRLVPAAETVVRLGGPQGRYAVFALGIVALGVLFVVFRSNRFGTGGEP